MDTTSYWIDTTPVPRFPKLSRNMRTDVVVVGGGIAGVTAAYLFKKAGCDVVLLERETCGNIDTGHTTAHLTCVTDTRLHTLVDRFGKDHARAAWDGGSAAIDQIFKNIQDEHVPCEFAWLPGYLHSPVRNNDHQDLESLQRDAKLANELGFPATFMEAVPLMDQPGVKFYNQAKFHPRKYLAGLLKAIPGKNWHVYEHTEVSGVEEKPMTVNANEYRIECRYVVLATHSPLMGKSSLVSAMLLQSKLFLYTSYVIGAKAPPDSLPEALFWDTNDPYNHLRVDRDRGFDYVFYGGEDHKTGQADSTILAFHRLETGLHRLVRNAKIDHRWSGQVIETPDGLPFMGETAERQFAVIGFAGNGMTFGTLGGMMAVDAYLHRRNPWAELFDIHRKKLSGAWDYIAENKDYPYYLLRDRVDGVEGNSLNDLKTNQGKILKLDGKKVAAFRDERGDVSMCSPVCTHLGCIVHWNNAEKTWDCPCHGSRFKTNGQVLAGPAEEDLEQVHAEV